MATIAALKKKSSAPQRQWYRGCKTLSVMKPKMTRILMVVGMGALSGATLVHCGSDNGGGATALAPTSNPGSASTDLGNFNLSCNGQASGQQKQVPFQQQQQAGCKKQNFQYQQQKAVDYDVNLDCDNKQVIVKNKGQDQQQQSIPIQSDGSVKGKVTYQQQLQSDGKGNQTCYVQYVVNVDGKAQCAGTVGTPPTSTPTPSLTVSPLPSASPSASPSPSPSVNPTPSTAPSSSPSGGSGKGKLSLTTLVNIEQASPAALKQAGISGPIIFPTGSNSPSPSPSPSASASPSPSASPSASPSVSPRPSPSVTPSPSISPTPTGTPVVVCVVDDPCPIVGSTDLSCGE
jgi:hypothetical protein